MIDTINLIILNSDKYEQTIHYLNAKNNRAVDTVHSDSKNNTNHNFLVYNIYSDTGNTVALARRTFVRSPSHTYEVACYVDNVRNQIAFNISVPKYTMQTNLFQFLDYINPNEYTTFILFRRFINFFLRQLPNKFDLRDIAITRIDLCFNQIFNSYEDSKSYLVNLEENMKSKVNRPGNIHRHGDNGLSYKTTEGYFKVYHKGDEFKKHDALQLAKIGGYDLPYLQSIADRTLRYESTLRNRKFKSIFLSEKGQYLFPDYVMYKDSGWIPEYFCLKASQNKQPFSEEFFSFLWNQFFNLIKSVQTNHIETEETIYQKVRDFANASNSFYSMSKNRNEVALMETAILSFHVDIKRIYKAGFMSKSTFYYKKKLLNQIGLDTFNKKMILSVPELDYYNYKLYLGYMHNIIIY